MINILVIYGFLSQIWLIYATFFSTITQLLHEFFQYNLQNNRLSLILFSVIQGITLN